MAQDQMQQISGRTIVDAEFRKQFFDDPDRTISQYDLTPNEQAILRDMASCAMTKLAIRTAAMRYQYFVNHSTSTQQQEA